MSKQIAQGDYLEMFTEFTNQLQRTQTEMIENWHDPMGVTMNSFFEFAEIANSAVNQIAQQHAVAMESFFPNATINKRPTGSAVTVQPDTGHVAVVTGGIGGIGTDICRSLAKHGNKVIATYISFEAERAIEWQKERLEEGLDIHVVECDVTNFRACKKMAKELELQFRSVDILVNCAGITRDATLKKMEAENWHAVLKTNLDSVFNVTRSFINGMVKRQYGRIINISSVNGLKGQFGQTNYSAAKAGMVGFTKSLARELADGGITVNTVSPGYVGTSMVEAMPKDIVDSIVAKIPVGRLAKPSEIGDAVAFLAHTNSGYITGSDISVNGGLFMG
ncbi:MAG: acetoacetyl-CoA reductase [Gammaproteobacteria bacterium]|jgi:acetoacetyl-CoA reductase